MPYRNSQFVCEACYDDAHVLRIKVTCPNCGATQIGNAADIVKWQNEHQCSRGEHAD